MMTAEAKAAWLSARCGKLTASRMADAMKVRRDGKPSAERERLMRELLAERVTGLSMPHVVTDAMEWGLQNEDAAIDEFVALTGRTVHLSRFYEHPTIADFGATPDRELDDGLLEVKCPTTARYLEWVLGGVIPEEHKPQMAAQLACSGKKWCGFIAYDPRVKDERRRLFMRKYEPSDEEIAAVEEAARTFLRELDEMFERFTTGGL